VGCNFTGCCLNVTRATVIPTVSKQNSIKRVLLEHMKNYVKRYLSILDNSILLHGVIW